MIAQKYITKIVAVIMAVTFCLCLAAIAFAQMIEDAFGSSGITMEYESRLFDTDKNIHINIVMDETEWEDMLANATEETYYQCDVEIDGQTFCKVGIRPKGNTSLTSIANDPDTDRYSFKLEFDQYVDGQTCYGLDKLILNNNYADATSMKEALIYDMYQYLGADASLYNYAEISLNGEYWGVYLALEAVEDSFMLRNYGTENGELYKPDGMNMGNRGGERPDDNDFKNMEPPASDGNDSFSKSRFVGGNMPEKFDTFSFGGMPPNEKGESDFRADEHTEASDERGDAKRMPGTGGFDRSKSGGFSMGGNGANLNYIDKDTDSYSTIWEGEVTKTTKSDHKRVVKALQNISEGTDIEKYMDVDNLLKYMAVHVFSVNEDSLLGMMAHNYYLYESDGQLNILPWDYNLALGGMGGMGGKNRSDSATSTINDAIDYAFSGTEFFDTLMEDEEYNKIYYGYLKQLVEKYIYGGGFEDFYHTTRNRIDSLVKSDPTAFYTYEEYEKAADTLYEVVQLRAKSISGQLAGTIPSTEKEQIDSDSLVDASHLDLSVMGSMSMNDSMRNWDGADAAPQLDGRELPDGFDRGNAGETVADNLILYGMCSIVLLIAIVFAKLYRRRFRYR